MECIHNGRCRLSAQFWIVIFLQLTFHENPDSRDPTVILKAMYTTYPPNNFIMSVYPWHNQSPFSLNISQVCFLLACLSPICLWHAQCPYSLGMSQHYLRLTCPMSVFSWHVPAPFAFDLLNVRYLLLCPKSISPDSNSQVCFPWHVFHPFFLKYYGNAETIVYIVWYICNKLIYIHMNLSFYSLKFVLCWPLFHSLGG